MTKEKIIQYAIEEGFAAAEVIDTKEIPFDPTFRQYCEENLCGKYGINWSCPPDCGSTDDMKRAVVSRPQALVLQTIWQISDYTDKKAIKEAKNSHNAATVRLAKRLRTENCNGFLVGASGCGMCETCSIVEGKPCRLPEFKASCMSAYCIFVSKLCEKCNMEYDCGEGLLGFFGMYVMEEKTC